MRRLLAVVLAAALAGCHPPPEPTVTDRALEAGRSLVCALPDPPDWIPYAETEAVRTGWHVLRALACPGGPVPAPMAATVDAGGTP